MKTLDIITAGMFLLKNYPAQMLIAAILLFFFILLGTHVYREGNKIYKQCKKDL